MVGLHYFRPFMVGICNWGCSAGAHFALVTPLRSGGEMAAGGCSSWNENPARYISGDHFQPTRPDNLFWNAFLVLIIIWFLVVHSTTLGLKKSCVNICEVILQQCNDNVSLPGWDAPMGLGSPPLPPTPSAKVLTDYKCLLYSWNKLLTFGFDCLSRLRCSLTWFCPC